MGIGEDTATSATRYAAAHVRYLAEAQTPLPGRPAGPSGRTRPTEPAAPIDLDILDYFVHSRAELIEHTQANADVTAPVSREEADIYAWYEHNSPRLSEGAYRTGQAIAYRQGLEARILARTLREGFWPERCPSCMCFSLRWQPALWAAVCGNTKYDSDEDGRPRTFTLAQVAQKAVEILTVRAAT